MRLLKFRCLEDISVKRLKGVITPIVSVFDQNENIDERGFRSVITHLLDHGVNGLFTAGGQGEGYSLTADEKTRLLDLCLEEVNGRVPVMAGTGAITTRASIELTRNATSAGADAAVLITPYYISPTQDEMFEHYRTVLEATNIPIFIYNNPWRTHINIAPETVARLCEVSPHMCGIKDSSGDLARTTAYKHMCPEGFKVFIGRDQLICAGLLSGLDGTVAATSNAAIDLVVGIYREFAAGNIKKAWEFQHRLTPLREFFSQGTFPVVVKEAMVLQGLPSGPCRQPVSPLSAEKRSKLKEILRTAGLLN